MSGSNLYHFVTRWRVVGTREEVADILSDPIDLPRWWPAVYLDVRVLDAGGPDGVGRAVDLWTKGWLPYTLRWRFTTTENRGPEGLALDADGDFKGTGRWTFAQYGDEVEARYDWRIAAQKPLLRRLTWLLRPAFSANHRWAMRTGEESLRLELARRRATTSAAAARIPPPPSPTFATLVRHRRGRV